MCSKEYLHSLEHAGFSLEPLKIENDKRMSNRVRRKLNHEPYHCDFNPQKAIADIKNAMDESVKYIFLNQYVLRPLAKIIKESFGDGLTIMLLSHGLASVDFLHEIRASSTLSGKSIDNKSAARLGRQLIEEASHSRFIDHLFCLAPFEVEVEKWLGAKAAAHVPGS